MGWINVSCIIIVICLLIPIVITNNKNKNTYSQDKKVSCIAEKISQYSTMFLMIFNIGIDSLGFSSVSVWIAWTVANFILIILYWISWISYSKNSKQNIWANIIQGLVFALSGVVFEYWLLIIFGAIFTLVSLYNTFNKPM